MKKIAIVLLILCFQLSYSQFPSPTNFVFSSDYLPMGETGVCAGEAINGPAYCDSYIWEEPNLGGTTATLEYYNVYNSDPDYNNVVIITSTTNIHYEVNGGLLGHAWITAVYSNPEGESEPSNIQTNDDLPLSISELNKNKEAIIYYNQIAQKITLLNDVEIKQLKIFDINGRCVKTYTKQNLEFDVFGLSHGIYYIKILTDKNISNHKLLLY